ncbi:GNAT family N-acetyltransferase [Defluviimonas sp. WL0024]|uniref:GNAT family N-acetyltransferase n=2 Tax=Albidovulum TaxID=205889 RepID=A0ABT3J9K1_9RHOB|nr:MULTISPECIES: GNAT family N-acetyltransferase [Defluviimonas]MCU9848909.1 GNAT family N-acetyltransferase [Defluviimonas sp. WL0024]MCW3784366.1 GNAT family N-acetyltransferase [Defluviimonas salinarum]
MTRFREGRREDVVAVIALLADDDYGAGRETAPLDAYLAAFDAMQAEGTNHLIVGERDGRIVATYQMTFITGLSHRATRRAQVESVRVAADLRGQGIGRAMMADAEARARAAGCRMMQLTTQKGRNRAREFYDRLGFTPSHIGYKRELSP